MAKINVQVAGLTDTIVALNRVRAALSDEQVLNVIMQEGGEPLRARVEDNAPRLTGELKQAIIAKEGRKRDGWPTVIVAVDFKKIRKQRDWGRAGNRYPYIVEFGSKPHVIRPKKHKYLSINGNKVYGPVQHPGFTERRYFRRSLNQMRGRIKTGIEGGLRRLVATAVPR